MSTTQGFYASRVFPYLNDRPNAEPELERLRDGGLLLDRGRVVEIGPGTTVVPQYIESRRIMSGCRSPLHAKSW